jgi:hypothetical protein
MLKESITYVDFNGLERTEEFRFNLTKTELTRMETSKSGSLSGLLTKIVNAKDMPDILEAIEMLILKSYGEVSPDGKRFDKSEKLSEDFSHTAAYDTLFEKLINDDKYAYNFILGIMPKELADQVKQKGDITQLQLPQK